MSLKNIKMKDLTEEQRKQLSKLFRRFLFKESLVVLLHIGFLLFANLTVVLVDAIYVKNQQFVTFMFIANVMFMTFNMINIGKEHQKEWDKEIEKIVKGQ